MGDAMQPVATLAEKANIPFPGASDAYRDARRALFAEEIEARRLLARIADHRRALPPGPVVARDYRFRDANGDEVGLAGLFGGHDTLIAYFWMYGPDRARPCPMCTNWLGSVNGNAPDIEQRAALRILGRSPVERQVGFAEERAWKNLTFVQTIGDDWARDLGLLNDDGTENPGCWVFTRDGDDVRLFWSSAQTMDTADPGQDPRDGPDIASLWNILDLTPAGRGTDWYPKLSY